MSASWQVSATYVKSTVGAMRALGYLTRVEQAVSASTRAALTTPHAQSWWPGDVLIEIVGSLGLEPSRAVGIRASRDGMGPLVRPLAGVVLALTKSPFEALLNRLGTFVGAGVKGVESRVVMNATKNGAVVSFVFPEAVPAEMVAVWVGLFDVGFTLARSGRLMSEKAEPTTHRFEIAW